MVADCLTGDCTAVGVVFAVEDYLCTIANEEEEEERLAK
jgi:hypothetical protein